MILYYNISYNIENAIVNININNIYLLLLKKSN